MPESSQESTKAWSQEARGLLRPHRAWFWATAGMMASILVGNRINAPTWALAGTFILAMLGGFLWPLIQSNRGVRNATAVICVIWLLTAGIAIVARNFNAVNNEELPLVITDFVPQMKAGAPPQMSINFEVKTTGIRMRFLYLFQFSALLNGTMTRWMDGMPSPDLPLPIPPGIVKRTPANESIAIWRNELNALWTTWIQNAPERAWQEWTEMPKGQHAFHAEGQAQTLLTPPIVDRIANGTIAVEFVGKLQYASGDNEYLPFSILVSGDQIVVGTEHNVAPSQLK